MCSRVLSVAPPHRTTRGGTLPVRSMRIRFPRSTLPSLFNQRLATDFIREQGTKNTTVGVPCQALIPASLGLAEAASRIGAAPPIRGVRIVPRFAAGVNPRPAACVTPYGKGG
jgi:hypothetical protein